MPYKAYAYELHLHHIFAANGFFGANVEINIDGNVSNETIADLYDDLELEHPAETIRAKSC